MKFEVIDKETGGLANPYRVVNEKWACRWGLYQDDMQGFALMEDGRLILMDECNRYVICPEDRFEIRLVTGEPKT